MLFIKSSKATNDKTAGELQTNRALYVYADQLRIMQISYDCMFMQKFGEFECCTRKQSKCGCKKLTFIPIALPQQKLFSWVALYWQK